MFCFVLYKLQYSKAWQKLLKVVYNQEVFNSEWKHHYIYTQKKKKNQSLSKQKTKVRYKIWIFRFDCNCQEHASYNLQLWKKKSIKIKTVFGVGEEIKIFQIPTIYFFWNRFSFEDTLTMTKIHHPVENYTHHILQQLTGNQTNALQYTIL